MENRIRNFATKHESDPHMGDVTNHDDGTCTFMLDTIPDNHCREIRLFRGDECLFAIHVGKNGVRFWMTDHGDDLGCFTLWDDENANGSWKPRTDINDKENENGNPN